MNITTTEDLKLRYWSDPILSTVCDPVRDSEFGPALAAFADKLLTKMETAKGVGLAAPQVGVPIRMFAMHTFVMKEGSLLLPKLVVCNPTLELSGEREFDREGCLSVPTIFEGVARSHTTIMKFFTPLGEACEVELHAMNARVVQHETDHLDGIMFFDRSRVSRQVNRAVEATWRKKRKLFV